MKTKEWTVEQLLNEIAAIAARLETDMPDDALYMCRTIVTPKAIAQAIDTLHDEEDYYED